MSKTQNNIRWWLQEKMGKSQRKEVTDLMEHEHKISERTIIADMNHGSVPPWRRNIWRKEIENIVGVTVHEREIFPDQETVPDKEEENVSATSEKEKVK